MKIAIDARFLGKSGIGTYIENVVFFMLKNHPEHEYLLIVCSEKHAVRLSNVKSMICDIRPFSLKELFFFPVAEINKCDVFYSPYINLPLGIRIPVCSTIHDVLFLDVDGLVSFVGKYVRKFFLWFAVKRSKTIFTVSEFSKARIEHYFKKTDKIAVTYCGVSKNIKECLGTPNLKDYFIFIGNVKKHKGLHVLIEAFCKAKQKGLSSKLYIVGNRDNFRTSDSSFEEKMMNNEDVVFTGFLSNEAMFDMLKNAKALVLPSFYEGFGLPPLEALYLGTNVVISDIAPFVEIYKGFPVTYFRSGDVNELENILINFKPQLIDVDCVRREIDQRYNFTSVVDKILSEIMN